MAKFRTHQVNPVVIEKVKVEDLRRRVVGSS